MPDHFYENNLAYENKPVHILTISVDSSDASNLCDEEWWTEAVQRHKN